MVIGAMRKSCLHMYYRSRKDWRWNRTFCVHTRTALRTHDLCASCVYTCLFDRYGQCEQMRHGACCGWWRRRRCSLGDLRKPCWDVSLATTDLLRARVKARRGQTHTHMNSDLKLTQSMASILLDPPIMVFKEMDWKFLFEKFQCIF